MKFHFLILMGVSLSLGASACNFQLTDQGLQALRQYQGSLGLSSDETALSLDLGVVHSASYRIEASSDFTGGTVQLSVDYSDLKQSQQSGDDITMSVEPSSLELEAGGSKDVTIVVRVNAHAPSFSPNSFRVKAAVADAPEINASLDATLQVNAIFNVYYYSANPNSNNIQWIPFKTTAGLNEPILFRPHTGNLLLRFHSDPSNQVNYIIHGAGDVVHEGDDGTDPGDYYEVVINSSDVSTNSLYYMHGYDGNGNGEGQGKRQCVGFNDVYPSACL